MPNAYQSVYNFLQSPRIYLFIYFIYFQQKLTSVFPILVKTVGLAWMVCTNTLVHVQVHMVENDAKVRRINETIPPQ